MNASFSATDETARRRKTRERLLEAALGVFAQHGVRAASVEQITEAAGFTRGAFYSNFSTKEELFYLLMEREHEEWLQRVAERIRDTDDALLAEIDVDSLGALIVELLGGRDDREWYLVQLEFQQLALRDPAIAREYQARTEQLHRGIAELLAGALERLGRRPLQPFDEIARILAVIYENALAETLLANEPVGHVAERARRPLAAVLLGLTARA